jgi:hypothetical protein
MRILSLRPPGGWWFRRFRHQPGDALADAPARRLGQVLLQQHRRQWKRRKRLILLALFILTYLAVRFILPLQVGVVPSLQRAAQADPGAPSESNTAKSAAPFCDTPAAVFAHFHLPESSVPGVGVLSQLPAPVVGGTASNLPVTYDPVSGRLCARSASDLSALFLPPQSAGAGASTAAPTDSNPVVGWAVDALEQIEQTLVTSIDSWLAQQIQSLGFVTDTSPSLTYQNSTIQKLNAWLVAGIGGILAVVFMVAGYNYMFGAYRWGWSEFAPKIIVCAVLASFSLSLLGMAIEVERAIVTDFQPFLGSFPPQVPNNPLGLDGIVFLIELVAILLLSLQMLIRLAILNILLALAPLGIMCYALPQSRPWGRAWALAFVSALIAQPLQIFAVGIGAALIGALGDNGNLIGALVGIGVIYVAWKIPGMLLSNSLRAMTTVTRDTLGAIGSAAETVGNVFQTTEKSAETAAAAVV